MSAQPDYGPPPEYEPPDPGTDSLGYALTELAHITKRLGDDIPHALDQDDRAEVVIDILGTLNAQITELQQLAAFVEKAGVSRVPFSRAPQQIGGYLVEVHGGKKRKTWEHDRLAVEVCRDLAVDENGVVNPETAQIVALTRNRIINCAGISYWRIGQLEPLGIQVDEFCATSPGHKTLQLTPSVVEATP